MLLGGYFKQAIKSIKSTKWRSLLTMLGIIIGVVSVVTTISLGEGVKKQVSDQISRRGDDLITVLPGQHIKRDSSGKIAGFSSPFGQSGITFTELDYRTVEQIPGMSAVVPFGRVVGLAKTAEREYQLAEIVATTDALPHILNQKLEFGTFYSDDEVGTKDAVIGRKVAEELFVENVPLGKSFFIRDREFIVRGVFEDFIGNPAFLPGADYNRAVFIPYKVGQELMGGTIQIHQILAKPEAVEDIDSRITEITSSLRAARGGQQDFVVLKQAENLALAHSILSLLTNLITGIAAISLLVGGIGIMNIMLVAVSERTREIGIRKAVGATNRQILYQFVTEAGVLSVAGGLLGVLLSMAANVLLRIFTDLKPVITLPVVGLACGLALGVGILFGAMPALRAARKDPIDALRHE